jgi:DNA modification methylase
MDVAEVPTHELAKMGSPYNPRFMPSDEMVALRGSLRTWGVVQPVVANRRSGRVVGGHQRILAAEAEGIESLPVTFVDLDDVNEKLLNVALNKISGDWDEARLAGLLAELEQTGADMSLTGFDPDEVEALLRRIEEPVVGLTDPDEVHEPQAEVFTQLGDLIVLGKHRLLCGDATNPGAVSMLLGDVKPGLMVTDPPYGVSLDMEWRDRAGKNVLGPAEKSYMRRGEGHKNTSISGDTIADWSHAFALVPSIEVAYVWHASSFTVDVGAGLRNIGFDLRQMIIWAKPHFVLSRTHYHYQTEPCWYAVRSGKTASWIGTHDQSNLWEAASPKALMQGSVEAKEDHPTQKPIACMEAPLLNHDHSVVYEPFGGSGTTLIAAERNRKNCMAMEVDPRYCDVIVRRWQAFTGERAQGWRGNE